MTLRSPGSILLVSCYELGHQPLGIVTPLALLERAGFRPEVLDIAVEALDEEKLVRARFVGISVPMHTALRLGIQVARRVREVRPACHVAFYGLYAALNARHLLDGAADSCIGGEYEGPLLALVEALDAGVKGEAIEGVIRRGHSPRPFLGRAPFAVPARDRLPPLERYAHLEHEGEHRLAGYVEASRGCLHLCTHCPIPPIYGGRFLAVPREIVLEDVRRQVAAGASHITFGDPDFLNGPTHSVRLVRAVHAEFPELTFDFTAKVEHLLHRGRHLPELGRLGCLFVVSAVESLSDRVLEILDKNHTRRDVRRALEIVRRAGIALRPTFVPFTPWAGLDDYLEILDFVEEEELVDHVDPVQYTIRLLVPPGSLLADHPAMRPHLAGLDESALTWQWRHPDPRMDHLQRNVTEVVSSDALAQVDPAETFGRIRALAGGRAGGARPIPPPDRRRAPRLTEAWFC